MCLLNDIIEIVVFNALLLHKRQISKNIGHQYGTFFNDNDHDYDDDM